MWNQDSHSRTRSLHQPHRSRPFCSRGALECWSRLVRGLHISTVPIQGTWDSPGWIQIWVRWLSGPDYQERSLVISCAEWHLLPLPTLFHSPFLSDIFPQRFPNSQPPSPHPSFYLLPPASRFTSNLYQLYSFPSVSPAIPQKWFPRVAERVGSLSSSPPTISDFSFVDSTPRTSGLLSSRGAATPATGYGSSPFSSPRKAS